MNWGYRIVLSFLVFITVIITMVVISMRQDVGLISEDYYKQEIAYQDQIERIRRTKALDVQPKVDLDSQAGMLQVTLPQQSIEAGELWLFRPSDNRLDRFFDVPSSGVLLVPVGEFATGRWKVKLAWTHAGLEYYTESSITL